MSRRSVVLLLLDMIDCIEKLAIVTAELSYDEFCNDVKAFYAAMSLVSILGEAALLACFDSVLCYVWNYCRY